MKTTINFKFIVMASLAMLFNLKFLAQDNAQVPKYISVTTMHWNMDKEDYDRNAWIALEKEYMQKVTMKNEYILSASYYTHLFTPNSSEVLYVQTYPSWDAIEKSADKTAELVKQAWPDEKGRDAFFKKLDDYYSVNHSDEIYATVEGAKLLPENTTKDLVMYVRRTHLTFPEDGSQKEFNEMRAENFSKVLSKNEYIKGYYPVVHAWGSDRTEFVEAFFAESLCDMEKMFDKNRELIDQAWPGDTGVQRGKKWNKYFTGIHGDEAYTLVAALSK